MIVMTRKPLEDYLALAYPFQVIADPDGGYVIKFPDLPGCFTQVDDINEVGSMADEIRRLWLRTEYELGHDIPLPSGVEEYSGKFVVRVSRSLHRELVQEAEREGISLNQYVATLLAGRDVQARLEQRIAALQTEIGTRFDDLIGSVIATRPQENVLIKESVPVDW